MNHILLLIGVAVAIIVVWRLFRLQPNPGFKNTQEMILWLSSQAEQIAKDSDVTLDYTPESIEKVEDILDRMHQKYQTANSTEGMKGIAIAFGAYIGEVIRRSEPDVHWDEAERVAGDRNYALNWADGQSFPVTWCYKRLSNGDEDNVWHKYLIIKQYPDLIKQSQIEACTEFTVDDAAAADDEPIA